MTVPGNLIMIFFVIAQRIAMRLTYGARGPQPDDKVYFALSVLNWVLFIGALVPLVAVMPWWIGLLIALLIVGALDEGLRASRQLQRQVTVTLLRVAAERGLVLGDAVFRHATDQGGSVGRATRRLAADLQSGVELSQAVVRNRNAVPRETTAYAAVGAAVGDQPAALAEASRPAPAALGALHRLLIDRVGYVAILGVFMISAVAYMLVQLVPQYAPMLDEFEVPLPAATRILVVASDAVGQSALSLRPLVLVLISTLLVLGILSLCGLPVLRVIGDRAMPGGHRATILRSLALAAERNQPLDAAIHALAQNYPSRRWRRKLHRAGQQHEGGSDWSSALLRGGVIRPATRALLRAGQRVGNLPWTLRTAADREEARETYRWTAWIQVFFPVVILCFAAIVGFICYALFVPLVEIVNHLAPNA